jgi:hypothetical protein
MPRDAKAGAATPLPTHILLLSDCEPWRAGKVLPADQELLARLTAEKAEYRPATKRECELHGITN